VFAPQQESLLFALMAQVCAVPTASRIGGANLVLVKDADAIGSETSITKLARNTKEKTQIHFVAKRISTPQFDEPLKITA
jgi:hypothetical protein